MLPMQSVGMMEMLLNKISEMLGTFQKNYNYYSKTVAEGVNIIFNRMINSRVVVFTTKIIL